MPRLKKITKRLKAASLTKPYIKAGCNQSRLARQRGVTRQTINEQVHSKTVKDTLQDFLDSEKLSKSLITVAQDGLKATINFKKKSAPDHVARYRFWNGLMQAKGKIKQDGREAGIKILNVVYGYRPSKPIAEG